MKHGVKMKGGWLGAALLAAATANGGQMEPLILHSTVPCWPESEFLIMRAVFQPGVEIVTAKAYFRSSAYPDFYYVELAVQPNGDAQAVMPKPSPETKAVTYYLEAVTRAYQSARSPEWTAAVSDPESCRRRTPYLAWFRGSPEIVVGATRLGASAIPPGFSAAGITGFISASGGAAATGGFGTGATIAVIGGAAAGAGVLGVTLADSSAATTTTVASGLPATNPVTTSTTTTAGSPTSALACFTTLPNPPVIVENESIRFDASCSRGDGLYYSWNFGNGKLVEGSDRRVVNTLYTAPGAYMVELDVTDSRGSRANTSAAVTVRATPPAPTTTATPATADVTVTLGADPAKLPVGETILFTVDLRNNGPGPVTGITLKHESTSFFDVKSFQISQGSCVGTGDVVTCSVSSLGAGALATLEVKATAIMEGPTQSSAFAQAVETDPQPTNNKAVVDVRVTK